MTKIHQGNVDKSKEYFVYSVTYCSLYLRLYSVKQYVFISVFSKIELMSLCIQLFRIENMSVF